MNGKQLFTTFNNMNVEYWVKGPKIRSIFLTDEGTECLDQDFSEKLEQEHYWTYAYSCGYGQDSLRYLQEHDYIHHWLADRLHGKMSPALLYAATRYYKDGHKPEDMPESIKHEEDLVHMVQQYLRLFPDMPERVIDRLPDHQKESIGASYLECMMKDLKRDIAGFFDGQWDLYPGAAAPAKYLVWVLDKHGQEAHDREKKELQEMGLIKGDA